MSPRIPVRVQPGARRDAVVGRLADGTWRLAVRAAPEGGRANRAVEELLARVLDLPRSRVSVVRGASQRGKLVEVEGLEAQEIARRLAAAQDGSGRTDGE